MVEWAHLSLEVKPSRTPDITGRGYVVVAVVVLVV